MMRRPTRRATVSILLCAPAAVLLHACGDNAVTQPTNEAPQTELQASAPRAEDGGFAVDFSFSGMDTDGRVEFFEWRVLSEQVQEESWTRTDDHELTLFFPEDPLDFGSENAGPSRTFQVRAVDDRGLADPTAAVLDFAPLTLSPEISISQPLTPANSCIQSGAVVSFRWTATDADSKSGAPAFVRYILKPAAQLNGNCLTRVLYESQGWVSVNDPNWSHWIPYDPLAGDWDASRSVTLPRQEIDATLLFAVQARDIDGATSRSFGWMEQAVHFRVSGSVFPVLVVDESAFGQQAFVGLNGTKSYDITYGQVLEFSWTADAASYLGRIDGYRFGWDLVEPDDPDDANWAVQWGDGWGAATNSFDSGIHTFVVQTRDKSGTVTRATYELTVVDF
jgi:hypothetical protein